MKIDKDQIRLRVLATSQKYFGQNNSLNEPFQSSEDDLNSCYGVKSFYGGVGVTCKTWVRWASSQVETKSIEEKPVSESGIGNDG